MNTLFFEKEINPYDLLFRDFFSQEKFQPATKTKTPYPVDIFEDEDGLSFEIACTGLDKKQIKIDIEGDILRIKHEKKNPHPLVDDSTIKERKYIQRGIAKRSFDLGYKISSIFNLDKIEAEMDNGLLKINIPFQEESKPKEVNIK